MGILSPGVPALARDLPPRVRELEALFVHPTPSISLGEVGRFRIPVLEREVRERVDAAARRLRPRGVGDAEPGPAEILGRVDPDRVLNLPLEVFAAYHLEVRPRDLEPGARDWRALRASTPAFRTRRPFPAGRLESPGAPDLASRIQESLELPEGPDPDKDFQFSRRMLVEQPPHVLWNSVVLARHLNTLATREDPEGIDRFLDDASLDVRIFEARALVNFVDLWVRIGGEWIPVRIPTWVFASGWSFPAAHSELLLVFRDRRTDRIRGMASWFMALPISGDHQGALFHPAVFRRPSWSGYRILGAFTGAGLARRVFAFTRTYMKTVNFLIDHHALPRNGYGCLAICNDSVELLVSALDPSRQDMRIWPLVRDPAYDRYFVDVFPGIRAIPSDVVSPGTMSPGRVAANLPWRGVEDVPFPRLRKLLARAFTGSLGPPATAFREGLTHFGTTQVP